MLLLALKLASIPNTLWTFWVLVDNLVTLSAFV